LAKENPNKALYPFVLAMFVDADDFQKREQYLLTAVALDPQFTEAYRKLVQLNSYDDAAAQFAQKAYATKKSDLELGLSYARLLWVLDPAAARKVYRELIASHAGTKDGADALSAFIASEEDYARAIMLSEELRRDYSRYVLPGGRNDSNLFRAYVDSDPARAARFAE
jgi:hypothetical protein